VSTGAIIAIIIGIVVLAAIGFLLVRASRGRAEERARRTREARDHRAQADAGVARARDLGNEADRHRAEAHRHAELADEHAQKADEHAAQAAELQEKVARAGSAAGRHDERAADLESKL
jgi:hypothetical protein